jgi:hypothetical protein
MVNKLMNKNTFERGTLAIIVFVGLGSLISVTDTNAQGTRKKRTPPTASRTVPATTTSEPLIISRAEDFPDNGIPLVQTIPVVKAEEPERRIDENAKTIEDLQARLKSLESAKKGDKDEKQKRLVLNLDILTKAEQRADSLRKQLFEMIEKESTIRTRLDHIENNVRPEAIDREVAFAGTLRPEELRAMRKKSLEIERTNLQSLLAEVQKTRANIDQNVQKADGLVERFRAKLEKEIDDALADEPIKP